ncbi:hypothetical protein FHETE_8729 [Fusarium heterosporum]|uniref:Zn(2)-C6 fungal-type domain-containing protein n=1 Tax=Fusarium heterosporum TaxID=42747 RepID=A0A8H5T116_FUSHE|nr:hypothetical protein FHETE_8729 [Fusarium heterosporum]
MKLLRRSCQACAKARRRCDLASPRCQRCSAKRITCCYVNEPAPTSLKLQTTDQVRSIQELKGHLSPQRLSRLAVGGALDTQLQIYVRQVLRDGYYQGSRPPLTPLHISCLQDLSILNQSVDTGLQIFNPLRLEIVRVFDQATLHHLSDILRSFPSEFAEHGTTSFIHSGIYGSNLPQPLQEMRDICHSYSIGSQYLASSRLNALRLTIRRLLRSSKRTSSFPETVAYAQAIIIAQILRLLECRDQCDDVERDNEDMWALTHRLWQHAPVQLPSTLSPWQAWLFSESVRRTIMVCNILLAVYSSLKRGYTIHALCIEALPFDIRTYLWDAASEVSWAAAASKDPEPSLVTLSQFTALERPADGGSRFEDLLLLSFRK